MAVWLPKTSTHPFKGWVFYFAGEQMDQERVVLVVDDDPQSRDLLSRFLHLIGCAKVVALESGEEAITYLLSHDADLVLLDYRLPGMSGLAALRHIKQIHPQLPVIIVTAYPTHEAMLRAIQEGASDLVVKPLDLKVLEKQVLKGLAA